MKCPFCQSDQLKVIDKRDSENSIRRRRECIPCHKRFTTYENIEETPFIVIKKDNTRRSFDKSKIRVGIIKACEKRPISLDEIESIVNTVEAKIKSRDVLEIPSKLIGLEIMKQLKKIDKIAYVRFASVYREFADIDDFKDAIKKL